jgi:hypothetical protein
MQNLSILKQCRVPRIILQKQKHVAKTNIKKQHLHEVYIAKKAEEEEEGEGEEPEEKKQKKHMEKEESSTVSTTIYS